MSSYQKTQSFKCRCPLIHIGVFGIDPSHQIPNIPCDRTLNDVFLHQHLQWYHNFDRVSARKLVRAIWDNVNVNEPLFSINETIVKQNVSVESFKCKCPLTHHGAFGLSYEHEITNVPCGRAEKEVLCFQHLQYHHNLSSRAAKKIVLAVLSSTPSFTRLFRTDDLVAQSKCAVRKLKSKCPLLSRHLYGLSDQHQVPNVPCDRADQHVFLFHHLTYFHKLNGKAATKLIRALITNKDPSEVLFHYNDIVVAVNSPSADEKVRRRKKSSPSNEEISDLRSKHHCFSNPISSSPLSSLMQRNSNSKFEPDSAVPLDYTRVKPRPFPLSSMRIDHPSFLPTSSYSYSTLDIAPLHRSNLNSYSTS